MPKKDRIPGMNRIDDILRRLMRPPALTPAGRRRDIQADQPEVGEDGPGLDADDGGPGPIGWHAVRFRYVVPPTLDDRIIETDVVVTTRARWDACGWADQPGWDVREPFPDADLVVAVRTA